MIDLEAIKQRHLRPEQMEHRTFYEGHIVIDLAALVEEVEHLRAELERTEHLRSSLDTALMLERDAERSAVVAWLRQEDYPCCRDCNGQLADWIERGDHRCEEPTP